MHLLQRLPTRPQILPRPNFLRLHKSKRRLESSGGERRWGLPGSPSYDARTSKSDLGQLCRAFSRRVVVKAREA